MKKQHKPKPLLAYSVREDGDGTGGIFYARNARHAAELGVRHDVAECKAYLEVFRAPYADRFSPGPCPHSVMVENGWWFEDEWNGGRIDADTMHERGLPIAGVVGAGSSITFACQADADAWATRSAEKTALGRAVVAALADELVRRLPHAVPITREDAERGHGRPYFYVEDRAGVLACREASVYFDFPGRQYNLASLGFGRLADSRPYAPESAVLQCSNGDVEAFNAFVASQSKPVV